MEHRGQNIVEYGLLLAIIALAVLAAGFSFGAALSSWYEQIVGVILAPRP